MYSVQSRDRCQPRNVEKLLYTNQTEAQPSACENPPSSLEYRVATTSSDLEAASCILTVQPEAVNGEVGQAQSGLSNKALAGNRCLVHQPLLESLQQYVKAYIATRPPNITSEALPRHLQRSQVTMQVTTCLSQILNTWLDVLSTTVFRHMRQRMIKC
jgi:hypothetical protein